MKMIVCLLFLVSLLAKGDLLNSIELSLPAPSKADPSIAITGSGKRVQTAADDEEQFNLKLSPAGIADLDDQTSLAAALILLKNSAP